MGCGIVTIGDAGAPDGGAGWWPSGGAETCAGAIAGGGIGCGGIAGGGIGCGGIAGGIAGGGIAGGGALSAPAGGGTP